jgi:hypothetical protein
MFYNRTYYVQHGRTFTGFNSNIIAAVGYWAATLGSVLLYRLDFNYGEPDKLIRLDLGIVHQILQAEAEDPTTLTT